MSENYSKEQQILYEVIGLPFTDKHIASKRTIIKILFFYHYLPSLHDSFKEFYSLTYGYLAFFLDYSCSLDRNITAIEEAIPGQLYVATNNICFYSPPQPASSEEDDNNEGNHDDDEKTRIASEPIKVFPCP